MTSFDKALEAAAEVFSNCRNGKLGAANSEEWIRSFEGHKEGGKWVRDFTIAEVVQFFREYDFQGWHNDDVADAIEQHFNAKG